MCPVCREVTTLGDKGVQGLANNLTVLALMDMMGSPPGGSPAINNPGERAQESAGSVPTPATGAIPKRSSVAPTPRQRSPMPSIPRQRSPMPSTSRERSPVASRTRESPFGKCVKCNDKDCLESQVLSCGHGICDGCLRIHLNEGGNCNECHMCETSLQGEAVASSGTLRRADRLTVPMSGASGTASGVSLSSGTSMTASGTASASGTTSAMGGSSRPPRPIPSPRSTLRSRTNLIGSRIPDNQRSPSRSPHRSLSPSSCQAAGGGRGSLPRPAVPARPPPFNPGYQGASGGASTVGWGEVVDDYRNNRLPDPDNLSLCSVASESTLSRSRGPDPHMSTFRRTQSMRRPPPPPQRQYGTLQRQQGRGRMLSPPVQNTSLSHSAENIRDRSTGTLPAEGGRQRHSMAEGSRPPPPQPPQGGRPPQQQGSGTLQGPSAPLGVSPPVPPPRRIFQSQMQSPTKLVKKFGSYSEVSLQTSAFRTPARVGLSEKGDIVIADTRNMTVQLFTLAGDYTSMFKVLGVQDACFMTIDKLCVASHMGVHIYSSNGVKIMDIPIGATIAVTPYKFGFIAATPKSLRIYRQSFSLVKEITKFKSMPSKKWSPIHKKTQIEFQNIRDITVTPTKYIAVLHGSTTWTVHIVNEDGVCSAKVDPTSLQCGPFNNPDSITSDFSNNIYIADTDNHRVLKFNSDWVFQRCVISFRSRDPNAKKIFPHGIAVTETGHIIVGLTGDRIAEIRVYNQVS